MKNLIYKAKKYKALDYLKQFSMNHLLVYSTFLALLLGFSKKSLEILRLATSNKLLSRLRKKYKSFIREFVESNNFEGSLYQSSKKVWVCWLQGFNNAPLMVKKCILSQQKYLPNREYIIINEENYSKYVTFPDYIVDKIDRGLISKTHFSDLLRLELLNKYGGTWIDATVFITREVPSYMLNSELFVFQDLKPGADGHSTVISSWFMTAQAGNRIISLTLALLYEYWRKNNKLKDYFLLHDFFQLAIEAYPDEWSKVIPFSNSTPHILLLRLFDPFDEKTWNAIKEQTPIHKLSYKFEEKNFKKKDTYFSKIIN
ncbi:capsular polysaccharide synthesis protein [Dubosiella newyorkensis]|uniref:capsular polysaccharide synthesis protein n=1 Tax=Dubosiella newyorkensis TaxID=1862672 RepID=UPI00258BE3B4|nr:capsular polysaccharide synthesis protein [Dubosiella newyorkensis]